MKTVPLLDFRVNLTDHLATARNGEPVIVTRYGKPEAALVPILDARVPSLIKALEDLRQASLEPRDGEDLWMSAAEEAVLEAYEDFREDLWAIVLGKEAPE